jgi:predicted transcriptional regulator
MTIQYKKVEKIVKGFANHRRIQILELLSKTPNLSVDGVSENLNVDFYTISDHIRKLSDSDKKYKGRFVLHTLTSKGKTILSFCKMFK